MRQSDSASALRGTPLYSTSLQSIKMHLNPGIIHTRIRRDTVRYEGRRTMSYLPTAAAGLSWPRVCHVQVRASRRAGTPGHRDSRAVRHSLCSFAPGEPGGLGTWKLGNCSCSFSPSLSPSVSLQLATDFRSSDLCANTSTSQGTWLQLRLRLRLRSSCNQREGRAGACCHVVDFAKTELS